jgi:hypothetical protein
MTVLEDELMKERKDKRGTINVCELKTHVASIFVLLSIEIHWVCIYFFSFFFLFDGSKFYSVLFVGLLRL